MEERWDRDDAESILIDLRSKKGKFTKTFIKQLWDYRETLSDHCNLSDLRMLFFTHQLAISPEGIKLLASFVPKIGAIPCFRLIQNHIIDYGAKTAVCEKYGEIIVAAWKEADLDEAYDLKEDIEVELIAETICFSVYAESPYCSRFRDILLAFSKAKMKNAKFESMIVQKLRGCVYTALKAENDVVRLSAAETFFMFYPLVDEDPDERQKSMELQHKTIHNLLSDISVPIRCEAIKKTFKLLGDFWLVIPKDVIRSLLSFIIDKLSKDSVISVRVAVCEGLLILGKTPSCLNAFEHALKCVCPRGINDKSEKVRAATCWLLTILKGHRFLNLLQIISRDELIARFELEQVENVRKHMVPLIHMLLPISKTDGEDYYKPRVDYMIAKSRMATLTYFRMLYPQKVIEVDMGYKLIEMLLTWTYRYLRPGKNTQLLQETSIEYERTRIYLECAFVLFLTIRKDTDADMKTKLKTEKMFGKIVDVIFENYRDTPILGTVSAISSVLPKDYLKSMAMSMYRMLENEEEPPEVTEVFIESVVHYNIDRILDSIERGLDTLSIYEHHQNDEDVLKSKFDVSKLELAVKYLKYIIRTHTTNTILASKDMYRQRVRKFTQIMDPLKKIISTFISQRDIQMLIDENLLLETLELKFIVTMFLIINDSDSVNERYRYVNDFVSDIRWFHYDVSTKFDQVQDYKVETMVKLSKSVFHCILASFSAWNFVYKLDAEEEKLLDVEGIVNDINIPAIIGRIIISFSNSDTPAELVTYIMKLATIVCEPEYEDNHKLMIDVIQFVPKWVKSIIEDDFEEDVNENEIANLLYDFYRKLSESKHWDMTHEVKFLNTIAVLSFASLVKNNENLEMRNPMEHDYEMVPFIKIMTSFAAKEDYLTKALTERIRKIIDTDMFVHPEVECNLRLLRVGSVVQFLIIIKKMTKQSDSIDELLKVCQDRMQGIVYSNEGMIKECYKGAVHELYA